LYDNLSGLAPDPAKLVQDDLTDWIFTFQSNDANAGTHALARWRATHSSPWLLASLRHARPSLETERLLSAAAAMYPADPAFLTAHFYREKLLLRTGRKS